MLSMQLEQLLKKALCLVEVWLCSGEYHVICLVMPSSCCYVVYNNRCIKHLEDLKLDTADQQLGVDIVRKSLRTPLYTIAKNAGAEPSLVVEKVLRSDNISEGYDALKDRYVDMMHEGKECSHSCVPLPSVYSLLPLSYLSYLSLSFSHSHSLSLSLSLSLFPPLSC